MEGVENIDSPKAGDLILQVKTNADGTYKEGHMGIFISEQNGKYQGWQMGNNGANLASWGEGGWFEKNYGSTVYFYRVMAK